LKNSILEIEFFLQRLYRAHKFMYYVYILKRRDNDKTYIGYTNNLKRRLTEHLDKKPELVYYEAYKSELDARRREMKLKQRGQSARRLKERLINSLK
jgi:predicted GIY-YIG superfamily endonuclease